ELAVNAPWLKQVTICVNHARIAEQTLDLGFKILIADAPGDEAMFNTLLTIH
ncbi:MAG: uroporphyrinogen III synthase, partial [Methylophilales bacterium 28-44-11]